MATVKNESNGSGSGGSDSMASANLFEKAKPFTEMLIKLYGVALPYWDRAVDLGTQAWVVGKPYYDRYYMPEMLETALGLILLFFGGQYAMSIACYTAIRISGWKTITHSWERIRYNYRVAMDALQKDPTARKYVDENNDGEISSDEIRNAAMKFIKGSNEEKLHAITSLRAVIVAVNPHEVMAAVSGIWTSLLAVIATLRSAFAKDVALGVSLGDNITKSLSRYVKPFLLKNADKEFKQWIDFLFTTGCKMFGVALALMLARVVSAFHSAIKGGNIIGHLILRFLANKQLIPNEMRDAVAKSHSTSSSASSSSPIPDDGSNGRDIPKETSFNDVSREIVEQNPLFMAIQYGLALYGFYWQLSQGFQLRFWLLRLILLPFTIVEGLLTWLAAH